MGNTSTTTAKPPPQQDIITQFGYINKVHQQNENIIFHMTHTNDYLFWLMSAVIILGLFFVARYMNICFNKRVQRIAASGQLQLRRMQPGETV